MGLSRATHKNQLIDSDFDECKWREWIRTEEIIRFVVNPVIYIYFNKGSKRLIATLDLS